MFKFTSVLAALVGAASVAHASHLDNIGGIFDTFKFDTVKFKTRTNCSLDKYPEVSFSNNSESIRNITEPLVNNI